MSHTLTLTPIPDLPAVLTGALLWALTTVEKTLRKEVRPTRASVYNVRFVRECASQSVCV